MKSGCQCEHAAHFNSGLMPDEHATKTPNGRIGHVYGNLTEESELVQVNNSYRVCKACAADCWANRPHPETPKRERYPVNVVTCAPFTHQHPGYQVERIDPETHLPELMCVCYQKDKGERIALLLEAYDRNITPQLLQTINEAEKTIERSEQRRADIHPVTVSEIREAITESEQGRSGRNVYAKTRGEDWQRIIRVRTHEGRAEGYALNAGKWFPIHAWETR